jgi:hypothetical protein
MSYQIAFLDPELVLALAGIRRLVVQIEAIARSRFAPLLRRTGASRGGGAGQQGHAPRQTALSARWSHGTAAPAPIIWSTSGTIQNLVHFRYRERTRQFSRGDYVSKISLQESPTRFTTRMDLSSLTECTYESVLGSSLPPKIVNLMLTITHKNIKLTVLCQTN